MSVKKLLFLLSILLFFTFIYLSYLVAKETFTQIDFDSTVRLQDHLSRRWDLPFSVFSLIGSVEITGLVWLIIFGLCILKKHFKAVLFLPLFFLASFIEIYGKLFVNHPAPPFLFYRGVLDFNFPSNYVQTAFSYPSGHLTRTAFLVAFGLTYLILKGQGITKFIFTLGLLTFLGLMVISRVYLGEHWLSDVVGGTLIGLSFGIIPAILIKTKPQKTKFLG